MKVKFKVQLCRQVGPLQVIVQVAFLEKMCSLPTNVASLKAIAASCAFPYKTIQTLHFFLLLVDNLLFSHFTTFTIPPSPPHHIKPFQQTIH